MSKHANPEPVTAVKLTTVDLTTGDLATDDLAADEQQLFERIMSAAEGEARQLAKLLVGKKDHELFGETEYQVRDVVHRLGAKAIEVAADEQQKKWVPRC